MYLVFDTSPLFYYRPEIPVRFVFISIWFISPKDSKPYHPKR